MLRGGDVLPAFVLAVVEINDPMLLVVVAAVFILTFVGVCAVAYVVLAKRRRDGEQTTWQFGARLPLTTDNFKRVAAGTAAAVSVPEVTPATRASFERLDRARGTFVTIYRTILITVGLAGTRCGRAYWCGRTRPET